jgi:ABC-2 type transport system ATP-binding protein
MQAGAAMTGVSGPAGPVIEVENLVVEYRGGDGKPLRAVDGLSFVVQPGECVGFIGANGAGKSTTMKCMMGFLFPTAGRVRLFGSEAGTVESRRRLGYLPEVALYYPFMKARELLELYGGLQGLGRRELRVRIPEVLEEVGLAGKGERLLKTFSKGMQQRLGIAQAIIARPELLVFDELSSGLDPVGRHDLRQVLLRLKAAGRTIFFSSHELTEVESLCDRALIIHRGRKMVEAPVAELMKPLNLYDIVFVTGPDGVPAVVESHNPAPDPQHAGALKVTLDDVASYAAAMTALATSQARIIHTEGRSQSLEQFYMNLVRDAENQLVGAVA